MAIAIIFVSLLFGWQLSIAQKNYEQYFPETGHWIRGEFLVAYWSVPDPLLVYGYPITEAYPDELTERYVQYFQKARLEIHPENPPELRVQQTPLGWYLYEPGVEMAAPPNASPCRYYHESGFKVCYDFLKFFDAHGGLAQFGYPISGFEIQNGRIVQYYQKARFEWHPERSRGDKVVLGELGREYFRLILEDPRRLKSNTIDRFVLNLNVHAFVHKPVVPLHSEQTITVIVLDQTSLPVPGARVSLLVTLPFQKSQSYLIDEPTDNNGVVRFTFPSQSSAIGLATIRVTAEYNGKNVSTLTAYSVWK